MEHLIGKIHIRNKTLSFNTIAIITPIIFFYTSLILGVSFLCFYSMFI